MKKKYRIVKQGSDIVVQQRFKFLWIIPYWSTLGYTRSLEGDMPLFYPRRFESVELAERYIDMQ